MALLRSSKAVVSQCFSRSLSVSANKLGRPEPASSPNMLDIGTRRIFNEDHDMLREACRRFVEAEIVPNHRQWEQDGMVSKEIWEKAGSNGYLNVNIPEEHGGIGADFKSAMVIAEEVIGSGCTGPFFSLHSDIIVPYISKYGSDEQRKRFIPAMTAGTCVTAIGMSEPVAGSDLQGLQTHAVRDGDDYILNGSKTWISNGQLADAVVVVAKTKKEGRAAHGLSLFVVERGMPGFERGKNLSKIGLKAQDTSELYFSDVRVPASNMLGEENKAFYYMMNELPQERLCVAVMAQTAAEALFEWTREYLQDRKAFGGPLSKMQLIKHRMAKMKTEISVGRAFIDSCIERHDVHELDSATASMAKSWASELQNRVADECVQLHGGMGYMYDYKIGRAYVDARIQPIYAGTNEIMMDLVSRTIFPN
ncbi:long-chain specific acyl-CoA dehydrogenase, mitochondrial-like [Sycon ciliatum]|uniref:long-chain specific acyl-CoA dehydrogenase, mitochondrial-like n=1 Tax=Sycon ciliatum TaxID=27933 RepID=UPI0020ADB8C2|eukprot:scpid18034/ scgid8815/ Long-chain specific acyl-CoA dehydrogenase, mitochondrial